MAFAATEVPGELVPVALAGRPSAFVDEWLFTLGHYTQAPAAGVIK
jgi:hypothetical protein